MKIVTRHWSYHMLVSSYVALQVGLQEAEDCLTDLQRLVRPMQRRAEFLNGDASIRDLRGVAIFRFSYDLGIRFFVYSMPELVWIGD